MPSSLKSRQVLLGVALAGLLVGCGPSGGTHSADAKIPEPTVGQLMDVPADGSVVALPLDAYAVTPADNTLLFRARQAATQSCMKSKGFDYQPVEQAKPPEPAPIDPDNLGLLSDTAARQTGYHRPPRQGTEGGGTATDPQSADYTKALDGDRPPVGAAGQNQSPGNGCVMALDRQMADAGLGGAQADPVSDLRAKAYTHTASDSRVKAAITAWSACMKKLGYPYASPAAASAAAWPDPVGQTELTTAQADMGCKAEVKLLATWYTVEAGYQRELIAGDEQALQAAGNSLTQRLGVAKKALGLS